MPDSPKVHLLIERPAAEASHSTFTGPMLALGRTGDWWPVSCAANIHDQAWMPLPTATDLTVEDVMTVLDAALADAGQEEHDAEHQGPTKAANYRRLAAETRAAVAKVKAALGGGVS